jgi:D-glycero-D-manno-heptose 1,7-bisphosphate phosphatase
MPARMSESPSAKRPAVFFDRDNTLIVNDGFLGDPSKVVLADGAAQAVARARSLGYATVTISNQSGVARGFFEEEDVHRVNARMETLLIADHAGALFDRHEFCPFHPEGTVDVYKRTSDRRKPGPGMILSAAQKLELDLEQSWVIGDAPRDVQAGRAAGCRTILIRAPGITPSPAAEPGEDEAVKADFTVTTLKEAMDVIEKNPPADEEGPAEAPVEAPAAKGSEIKSEKPWLAAAQSARAKRAAQDAPAVVEAPSSAAQEPTAPAPQAAQNPSVSPAPQESRAVAGPERLEDEPAPLAAAAYSSSSTTRLEQLAEQIHQELRRRHEHDATEFSVSKLLAGIVQVMALAAVFLAYVRGPIYLQIAIYLQTLTIALLIMTRQQ